MEISFGVKLLNCLRRVGVVVTKLKVGSGVLRDWLGQMSYKEHEERITEMY